MYCLLHLPTFTELLISESSVEHLRVCFRLDRCETTKSGTYSNLWHMHGLASVLKQPIQSIYPEVGERNRPFYHKVIQPRQACQLIPLIIMWTRALPTPLNKFWQPNHFVPCLRDSNISQIPASSTDTAKVLKDNVAVSRTVSEFDKAIISTPGVKHACCQSPLLQTGSTQHSRDKFYVYLQANSPLVQELDQASSQVDQLTSHALIQEQSTQLADSPLVQELDQASSLIDQPLIQDYLQELSCAHSTTQELIQS